MMRLAKGDFIWLKAILVETTHQVWLAQSQSDVKDHYWLFMWNRSAPVRWQRCSKWADCLTALGSPVLDARHGSLDKAGTRAGPNVLHGYTACTEGIRAPLPRHKNCMLMLAENGWNLSRPYDHLEIQFILCSSSFPALNYSENKFKDCKVPDIRGMFFQ